MELIRPFAEPILISDATSLADMTAALRGVDGVVHLAGRAHILNDHERDPQRAFDEANVESTRRWLEAARQAGVRKFVLASSIIAMGLTTPRVLTENDPCHPVTFYGISKWNAEQVVREWGRFTGRSFAILRFPVIYGPFQKANMLRLFQWVDRGIPFPLGGISNHRSFLFRDNAVDAIREVLTNSAANGETFLVSDGPILSTAEFVRLIGGALYRRVRLIPFPATLLKIMGKLTGKTEDVERLLGSLAIDNSKMRRRLNWAPPVTMTDGLAQTAAWYRGLRRA